LIYCLPEDTEDNQKTSPRGQQKFEFDLLSSRRHRRQPEDVPTGTTEVRICFIVF
jgi:hypothetical protein